VKHSGAIADRPVEAVVAEAVDRGRADGLVVSGPETGTPADADRLKAVCAARDERELDVPVFVGSGVTEGTVADHLERADGVIVGTGLKRDGETANPVDPDRVASLVVAARGA
jgi:predicted TIM-barrel enzyme